MTHPELIQYMLRFIEGEAAMRGPTNPIVEQRRGAHHRGEIPDIFHVAYKGTWNIDAKTSVADYIHDFDKPSRTADRMMGRFRGYVCPEDVIEGRHFQDLNHYLFYMQPNGVVRCVHEGNPYPESAIDRPAETLLLAHALRHASAKAMMGDPDRVRSGLTGKRTTHIDHKYRQTVTSAIESKGCPVLPLAIARATPVKKAKIIKGIEAGEIPGYTLDAEGCICQSQNTSQ